LGGQLRTAIPARLLSSTAPKRASQLRIATTFG
jgi:hypothetical protein